MRPESVGPARASIRLGLRHRRNRFGEKNGFVRPADRASAASFIARGGQSLGENVPKCPEMSIFVQFIVGFAYRFVICAAHLRSSMCPENVASFSSVRNDHNNTHDITRTIMLNDVMEHIQIPRYTCLFPRLQQNTPAGSLAYLHTPTPLAQLSETRQFDENVLPHDVLKNASGDDDDRLPLSVTALVLDLVLVDIYSGLVRRTKSRKHNISTGQSSRNVQFIRAVIG